MNNLGQTVDVDLRESSLDGTGKPRKDAKRILDGFGARKAYGRASAWGFAMDLRGFFHGSLWIFYWFLLDFL